MAQLFFFFSRRKYLRIECYLKIFQRRKNGKEQVRWWKLFCYPCLEKRFLTQDHFFVRDQLSQVNERIPHSAQCRINAYTRKIRYFFKAQVGVYA